MLFSLWLVFGAQCPVWVAWWQKLCGNSQDVNNVDIVIMITESSWWSSQHCKPSRGKGRCPQCPGDGIRQVKQKVFYFLFRSCHKLFKEREKDRERQTDRLGLCCDLVKAPGSESWDKNWNISSVWASLVLISWQNMKCILIKTRRHESWQ